jgi:hypothetical protein
MITFPVRTGPGLTHNALFTGPSDSRLKQTPSEHKRLLDITTLPGAKTILANPNPTLRRIGIANLRKMASAREKAFPKYWNDIVPRPDKGVRPISSSSWIGAVSYRPGVASIRIGTKNFTCPMSERQLKMFLESPSLGQYFNRYLKLR